MSLDSLYLGQITLQTPAGPKVQDIWVMNNPIESWERLRLAYYPEYDGPPPDQLDDVLARLAGYEETKAARGMLPPLEEKSSGNKSRTTKRS
jgi:hypothetical protein